MACWDARAKLCCLGPLNGWLIIFSLFVAFCVYGVQMLCEAKVGYSHEADERRGRIVASGGRTAVAASVVPTSVLVGRWVGHRCGRRESVGDDESDVVVGDPI